MAINNVASSQINPIKTNVLCVVKDDSVNTANALIDLPNMIDPRLPVDPSLYTPFNSEVVDLTGEIAEGVKEEQKTDKIRDTLFLFDVGMEIVNASADIAMHQEMSNTVDKIQMLDKFALGAKAVKDGNFSLDPQRIVNGTHKERFELGTSTAFVATCLSATVQMGSAIADAVGGGALSSVTSVCNDYVVPLINQGIRSPAMLFSYCANYHATVDNPEDTEEEKNLKQIQRGNQMFKAGITATKLATSVISVAAPTLAISATVATPLAVATIGAACVDSYLSYQNLQKDS